MADREVVLIDLSSIAHPIWHMSQADPDPNKTSQAVVARVRALAASRTRVAVCCDSGRSFRKDLAASYKANRPAAAEGQLTYREIGARFGVAKRTVRGIAAGHTWGHITLTGPMDVVFERVPSVQVPIRGDVW